MQTQNLLPFFLTPDRHKLYVTCQFSSFHFSLLQLYKIGGVADSSEGPGQEGEVGWEEPHGVQQGEVQERPWGPAGSHLVWVKLSGFASVSGLASH